MGLGSVSISDQTIDFIRSILPAGSTILEFGSGTGTKPYDAEFIAPDIVGPQTAWYDPADLLPNLPKEYDLILVDGPGGHFGRGGFFKYLDEFNTNIPLLFDDINRPHDFDLMVQVSKVLDRPYKVIHKDLGYIAYEN